MKRLSIFTIIAVFTCLGCNRITFSETPYIEFQSLEKIDNGFGYDDKAVLSFYFEDGDGDIGLEGNIQDSLATEDDYNFFVQYYEKQNGDFVLVIPKITMNSRIPPLSKNVPETISGIISNEIFINNMESKYDTVRFDFFITDRKNNRSNLASTGEVIIKKK